MKQDADHLQLLTIFHYVLAGMIAVFACIPIIHLILGISMLTGIIDDGGDETKFVGLIFTLFATFFILGGWILALIVFFAGRSLASREHHGYCFIVACIECLFMPAGTALGVFTILVLMRDSVKELFGVPVAKENEPSLEASNET